MAHAARISELTDGLVQSLAGERSQHASFRRMREQAAKTFRNTTHARTNQFEVQSKLAGLVEKFAVLKREELSDAFQLRLDQLPQESKWMPEILSLLLQLSDRPLEKTQIENVQTLTKGSEDEQPSLTWDDLVAERDLDEAGLWDAVERGYHSSGDEATVDEEGDSDSTESTKATSLEGDSIALATLHIIQPVDSALDAFNASKDSIAISATSELLLIRETLLMLCGLPTTLYLCDTFGTVTVQRGVHLNTAAQATMHNLLLQFAEIGSSLSRLRKWSNAPEKASHLQSCQAAVLSLLLDFNREMSTIEQQYVSPSRDTIVSVMELRSELEPVARSLVQLSELTIRADHGSNSSPFAVLDALYENTSVAESSGHDQLFSALANVFLSGLKTYLKPLSMWMYAGTIDRLDSFSMIMESNVDCDLGRLWYDRFMMRKLADGTICAPNFLLRLAPRIFAIGKSQAFLQALGGGEESNALLHTNNIAAIDSLVAKIGVIQLLPFSQLLDETLDNWIADVSGDGGMLLRTELLHEHALLSNIDRLEEVFCSKNGVRFQTFADTLFWRIDHQPKAWQHGFLLSELASSTFGSSIHSDAADLNVEVGDSRSTSSIRQIAEIRLQMVFSWPIQNTTRSRISAAHSKAFNFLLQTYRAKYLLRLHVLDLKAFASTVDNTSPLIKRALLFRQRLICFIDVVHNHLTTTSSVLHASMKKDFQSATDIDAMATVWTTHINELETSLLLAHKINPIREAITNCLEICERFALGWIKLEEHGIEVKTEIANMRDEFDKSISFVVAGVRSIGRASGSKMLEELAERLEGMTP